MRNIINDISLKIDGQTLTSYCPLPVAAGFRRQHEPWDGTCTLDGLPDIVELIRVGRENEKRAAEAARDKCG